MMKITRVASYMSYMITKNLPFVYTKLAKSKIIMLNCRLNYNIVKSHSSTLYESIYGNHVPKFTCKADRQ